MLTRFEVPAGAPSIRSGGRRFRHDTLATHDSARRSRALRSACARKLPHVPDRRNLHECRRHGSIRGAARSRGNERTEPAFRTDAFQHHAGGNRESRVHDRSFGRHVLLRHVHAEPDGVLARADRHARVRRARARHAGLRHARRLSRARWWHPQLRGLRPVDVRPAAHRRRERPVSVGGREGKRRGELQGRFGDRGAGGARAAQLSRIMVEPGRRRIGDQPVAPGRPDLRHLVHLRHERQRLLALDAREPHDAGGRRLWRRHLHRFGTAAQQLHGQRDRDQGRHRHALVQRRELRLVRVRHRQRRRGEQRPAIRAHQPLRPRRHHPAAGLRLQPRHPTWRARPTIRISGGLPPNRAGGSTLRTRATSCSPPGTPTTRRARARAIRRCGYRR